MKDVYNNLQSSFEKLLEKDSSSASIHDRNTWSVSCS